MNSRILKGIAGVIALLAMTFVPVSPTAAAPSAGTGAANLSISGGGTYTTGSTFSVNVSLSSTVDVYGVDASFSYDASKLRCDGVNGDGSVFANSYQSTCANGIVTIGRGTQGAAVKSGKVATVNFTAIATGTAALKATAATEIDDATTNNVCGASCVTGTTLASVTVNEPGKGADPVTPAPTKSTPVTPAPTKTTTPSKSATTTTPTPATNGNVEGAADDKKADEGTTKGDDKKADDKKDDSKNTDDKKNNNFWLWALLTAIVIGFGYYYARKVSPAAPVEEAPAKEAKKEAKVAPVAPIAASKSDKTDTAAKNKNNKNKKNKKANR